MPIRCCFASSTEPRSRGFAEPHPGQPPARLGPGSPGFGENGGRVRTTLEPPSSTSIPPARMSGLFPISGATDSELGLQNLELLDEGVEMRLLVGG